LKRQHGALVSQVTLEGPALAAGIEQGDIIIRVDDHPVERSSDLPALVGTMSVGDKTDIMLLREGKEIVKNVTIGKFGQTDLQVSANNNEMNDDSLVLVAGALSADELATVGLENGVLVKGVADNGAASKAGILVNDVIVTLNGVAMKEPADVKSVAAQATDDKPMPVLLQRGDQSLFVAVDTQALHQ